jgi:hypothetical protein
LRQSAIVIRSVLDPPLKPLRGPGAAGTAAAGTLSDFATPAPGHPPSQPRAKPLKPFSVKLLAAAAWLRSSA